MPLQDIHALMLRTVAREIGERMAPELRHPGAAERVDFALAALDYVAAHQDVLPPIAGDTIAAFRRALDAVFANIPANVSIAGIEALRARYCQPQATHAGIEGELTELRAIAAGVIRALADTAVAQLPASTQTSLRDAADALGSTDRDWLLRFAEARARGRMTGNPADDAALAPGAPPAEVVTPERLTAYLQRHFPGTRVLDVALLSGGRSKRTLRITLAGGGPLPENLVMRQDMALKHVNSRIADEIEPLRRLHARGVPVPPVLHAETDATELGPAFLLLPFLHGEAPGDYFGLSRQCRGAYLDLARALALLHRTPAADAGLAQPDMGPDPLRHSIQGQWDIWRQSLRPSPFIDHAFAWAVRDCSETRGTWAAVHGDCGPHNLLVREDRLVTILDWEFAHAGDPAEDLGITRIYAEQTMDWRDFMAVYRAAGGPEIPERRIRAGMLSHYLKGAALSATSTRNVVEGGNRDYIKAMISFTGLPQIELKLVELMQRNTA